MDLDAIRSRHQPNGNVVDGPLCTCGHVNCEEAQLLALLTPERIAAALLSNDIEPDCNWCTCGHSGSRHDLNNTCLDCGDRFGGIDPQAGYLKAATALLAELTREV